jgi:hypothetical protein
MSPSSPHPMGSHRRARKMKKTWLSSRFVAFSWACSLTLLQTFTKHAQQRTRKEWLSHWFSAGTHSVEGWLQVCCAVESSPRGLTDIDFVINPHDPCVANKIIDGKQMTISWHFEDLKASHVMPKVMNQMIKHLRQECKTTFEDGSGGMAVSRGKVHTHLGMTFYIRRRIRWDGSEPRKGSHAPWDDLGRQRQWPSHD